MIMDITKKDFDEFLPKWKLELQASGREYVYTFPLSGSPEIVIKVYSSIDKRDDTRRDVGQDAIRVCAVNIKTKEGWVSTTRVYRTLNWRDNLKKAVMKTFKQAQGRRDKNYFIALKKSK